MAKASDKTNGAAADGASQGFNISKECQEVDHKVKYYRQGKNKCKPIEHETIMTAYHEAGHAVVAAMQWMKKKNGHSYSQAVPFRYATIRPKKYHNYKEYAFECLGSVQSSSKYCTKVDMIVLFAGVWSESRVQPDGWIKVL
jgi:hypothetical protein